MPLVILTTTFDSLMEGALARTGARFTLAHTTLDRNRPLVWRNKQITIHEFVPSAAETLVYKVFGSPPWYAVTEEDDMELFGHMAEGRLPPPAVRKALAFHHILFIGMGLSTWPQRLMLRQLRGHTFPDSSSRGWAIVRGLGTSDRIRWRSAQVEPFDQDIDDFAWRLTRRLGIESRVSES